MANTHTVSASVQFSDGTDGYGINLNPVTSTQGAPALAHGVVTIGTSEETLSIGDVATGGLFVFKNRDATNYIEIGPDNGGTILAFVKCGAGKFGQIPGLSSTTIKAKANVAACVLEYWLFSE